MLTLYFPDKATRFGALTIDGRPGKVQQPAKGQGPVAMLMLYKTEAETLEYHPGAAVHRLELEIDEATFDAWAKGVPGKE